MAFKKSDAFEQDVAPGGARTKNEIRTLLCYIFYSTGKPLSLDTVVEALRSQALVNYFEATACFDDLIRLNNIELADKEKKLYRLTKNGEMIAGQLEDTLPLTMKEKAYQSAMAILEEQRLQKENPVTVEPENGGYRVTCNISDGTIYLLSVSVFAATIEQARLIRKNFHKNPEAFYKTTIALLSNNRDMATDALESIKISGK